LNHKDTKNTKGHEEQDLVFLCVFCVFVVKASPWPPPAIRASRVRAQPEGYAACGGRRCFETMARECRFGLFVFGCVFVPWW
jgi:hypothetical protein